MNRSLCSSLIAAALLAGCASTPDCDSARAAGLALGLTGQTPERVEQAGAPACAESFDAGWNEGLASYCEPRAGFERALRGQDEAGACSSREFRIDFELGRNIRTLRAEHQDLMEAAQDQSDPAEPPSMRLRVIERELSQLEGVARIRGLLPAVPD